MALAGSPAQGSEALCPASSGLLGHHRLLQSTDNARVSVHEWTHRDVPRCASQRAERAPPSCAHGPAWTAVRTRVTVKTVLAAPLLPLGFRWVREPRYTDFRSKEVSSLPLGKWGKEGVSATAAPRPGLGRPSVPEGASEGTQSLAL